MCVSVVEIWNKKFVYSSAELVVTTINSSSSSGNIHLSAENSTQADEMNAE